MTYILFDGRGYETWLAKSVNLLQWKTLEKFELCDTTSAEQQNGMPSKSRLHRFADVTFWVLAISWKNTWASIGSVTLGKGKRL